MKTKIKWGIIALITLSVGLGGLFKLARMEFFMKNAEVLHYSAEFAQVIGFFEVLACVGLYFAKWRLFALLGLCSILLGAIVVSVGAQTGIDHLIGPTIPLILCILVLFLDNSYKLIRSDGK